MRAQTKGMNKVATKATDAEAAAALFAAMGISSTSETQKIDELIDSLHAAPSGGQKKNTKTNNYVSFSKYVRVKKELHIVKRRLHYCVFLLIAAACLVFLSLISVILIN